MNSGYLILFKSDLVKYSLIPRANLIFSFYFLFIFYLERLAILLINGFLKVAGNFETPSVPEIFD